MRSAPLHVRLKGDAAAEYLVIQFFALLPLSLSLITLFRSKSQFKTFLILKKFGKKLSCSFRVGSSSI
jgi:hypothetical protein